MNKTIRKMMAAALVAATAIVPARAQLRSSGPVPADLKQSVQQLYDADLQRAKEYTGGRVRDRQQLMEASFEINKMLSGGHIVYGDPISAMLGRVADTLLKDHPGLRSELRFYTVTSPDVNAFTTPQGMVFVNTGLIAQVEDEAQLAFILSHEIVHYYRSHGLEELVGKQKRRNSDRLDDEAERAGDFARHHNRSRAMENEADSLGIAMFYLGSPYAKDVADGVFDVLQYSYLPFDDRPFDTTFFNTPYYTVGGCWLQQVADITSRDNYDDSRSTHPNILSRRQRAANALDGHHGGQHYVVTTKAEFAALQRMARMECIRQDLINGHFAKAFYNSWVMQDGQQPDPVLDRYMVQALYGMATFRNNGKQTEVQADYKKVEGESQQVHYALRNMTTEQLTLAALHQAWEAHLRHPHDEALTRMADDLMEQLRTKVGKAAPDFLATPPSAQAAAADTTAQPATPAADEPKTKYERIKQKRQSQTQRTPTAYALTDLMMRDSTLLPLLRGHLTGNATQPATTDAAHDTAAMLVFNPSYWVVEEHGDKMNIGRSMSKEDALRQQLKATAGRFGRRAVDFSDEGMHDMTSADQYNDFLSICEWMNEFWLTKGRFGMERLTQPAMDQLLDRYGARTINMAAVLNIEGTHARNLGYLIVVPLAPVVVADALFGNEHTTMVDLVVDAREGKVMTREVYNTGEQDAPALTDAMLYDGYHHALNPDKKELVGFMGRRLSITAGASLGPSGKQPIDQLDKYVALTPWVAAEFAVGRKASVFASARYQKAYEGATVQVLAEGNSYYYKNIPSSMNMLSITAGGRFYPHSEFAPLGRYISVDALMTHYSRAFDDGKLDSDNTFGLGMGYGQNFILFGRLVINYEVNYAWSFGYVSKSFKLDWDYDSNLKSDYIQRADGLYSNMLTIRLGIGFMPF